MESLKDFCQVHTGPLEDGDRLPFKLVEDAITLDELEGFAIDLTAQYLALSGIPYHVTSIVSKEVSSRCASLNLDVSKRTPTPDSESVQSYDASKVSRLIFTTVHEVARELVSRATPSSSPSPPLSPGATPLISCHAIKNTRRKMEDRHVIVPDLSVFTENKDHSEFSYYAVFDGHAGTDAASYAASHVLPRFFHQSEWSSNPAVSLTDALSETDAQFTTKAQRENLRSGATCLTVVVESGKKLYAAWLGDSQAFLVRGGAVETFMDPHKPEREDEKARVEALGGCVVFLGAWRVNGALSVSRAIGDVDHKPFISSEADSSVVDLNGEEEYLVLACDGLWDNVISAELPHLVYDYILKGGTAEGAAAHLVSIAKDRGSTDNITVVVTFFKDPVSRSGGPTLSPPRHSLGPKLFCGSTAGNGGSTPSDATTNGFGNTGTSANNSIENVIDDTNNSNDSSNAVSSVRGVLLKQGSIAHDAKVKPFSQCGSKSGSILTNTHLKATPIRLLSNRVDAGVPGSSAASSRRSVTFLQPGGLTGAGPSRRSAILLSTPLVEIVRGNENIPLSNTVHGANNISYGSSDMRHATQNMGTTGEHVGASYVGNSVAGGRSGATIAFGSKCSRGAVPGCNPHYGVPTPRALSDRNISYSNRLMGIAAANRGSTSHSVAGTTGKMTTIAGRPGHGHGPPTAEAGHGSRQQARRAGSTLEQLLLDQKKSNYLSKLTRSQDLFVSGRGLQKGRQGTPQLLFNPSSSMHGRSS